MGRHRGRRWGRTTPSTTIEPKGPTPAAGPRGRSSVSPSFFLVRVGSHRRIAGALCRTAPGRVRPTDVKAGLVDSMPSPPRRRLKARGEEACFCSRRRDRGRTSGRATAAAKRKVCGERACFYSLLWACCQMRRDHQAGHRVLYLKDRFCKMVPSLPTFLHLPRPLHLSLSGRGSSVLYTLSVL